jgi:hypothetical protein
LNFEGLRAGSAGAPLPYGFLIFHSNGPKCGLLGPLGDPVCTLC